MAVDDWPLLRWRMRQYRHGRWGTHIVKANPQARRQHRRRRRRTRAEHRRADRGASGRRAARAEGDLVGSRSDTKWVAEALFAAGVLTTATRVGFRPALRPGGTGVAGRRAGPRGRRRRGRPRAHAARGHRAGRGHRGRHPRLLPAVGPAGQAGDRRAGGRRRDRAGRASTAGRRRRICVPAGRCRGWTAARRCCVRSTR